MHRSWFVPKTILTFSAISLLAWGAVSAHAGVLPSSVLAEFDFNTGDEGFTHTFSPANFESPWAYSPTAGVGGSGGWSMTSGNAELGVPMSAILTSPEIDVSTSGAVTLDFQHRHSFEAVGDHWDGAAVLFSVNGGAFTKLPGSSFTLNGYNGTVRSNSNSALRGQEAFVENSLNFQAPSFLVSWANLGSFNAGDVLRVRFDFEGDTNTRGNFTPTWEIDNVRLLGPAVAVVPEPSTMAIMAVGLSCLAAARRRRKPADCP